VVEGKKNGKRIAPLTHNGNRPKADAPKEMHIEVVPISSLKPYERNARVHSPDQIRELATSMKRFGVTMPILIDRNRVVVAGHARLEALKLLGRERAHIISLENLTEAQVRSYRLADNKLAEKSSWDVQLLGVELREVAKLDVYCGFSIPGFANGELDFLIPNLDQGSSDESDEMPGIDETASPTARGGDLWVLGNHRLYCGDARNPQSFARLMETSKHKWSSQTRRTMWR
jgi:hypothetical protein